MCRHTGGSVASEHKMSIVVWSSFYWLHCLQNTFFPLQVEYLAQIQSTMIGGLKVEILLHRIYKYTHSERVRLKNVCLCELGMPIIFIFYMLMEGEPMCFKQKKKYKGDKKCQPHATSPTPSQTFMLFLGKIFSFAS
jgi:hypothetical protein